MIDYFIFCPIRDGFNQGQDLHVVTFEKMKICTTCMKRRNCIKIACISTNFFCIKSFIYADMLQFA